MKSPFQSWLPKGLIPVALLVLLFPTLSMSGVYTSNTPDLVGAMGTLSEYFTMANYATTIGMVVAYPLLLKVKGYYNSRTILLVSYGATLGMSVLCATTGYPEIIVGASLFIGFFKMFAMIELIIPIMMMLSPTGDRGRFYAFFYPLSIGIGQFSAWLTAYLTYAYNWSYAYYFMVLAMLACLLLVLLMYHDEPLETRVPVQGIDWLSVVLLASGLMTLNYVLAFGKYEDWLSSLRIQGGWIATVILLTAFVSRQIGHAHPFLDLSVLKSRNVRVALGLIFLMGAFFATGGIQTALTTTVLRFDNVTSAELSLWMLPGVLAGGMLCFFWFKYKGGFRGLLLIGFGAFIAYHLLLYFRFHPGAGDHDLWFPNALKGLGMLVLFVALGLYMANKMTMVGMINSGMLMIMFRSFIGPAVFSALYSWGMYYSQISHTQALGGRMDLLDPLVTARYQAAGLPASSMGAEAVHSRGAQALLRSVQVQAVLVTGQELFGYIVLGGLAVLVLILVLPLQPVNKRRLVNLRRRWRQVIPVP